VHQFAQSALCPFIQFDKGRAVKKIKQTMLVFVRILPEILPEQGLLKDNDPAVFRVFQDLVYLAFMGEKYKSG